MITRDEWAVKELSELGFTPSDNNVKSLVIWMAAEDTLAEFNPQATTMPEPGATDFNSVGVKNYPDEATGLKGFKDTITNGYYQNILDALSRSDPPAVTCSIIVNSPWGSKPTPELVATVLGDWVTYASVPVSNLTDTTPDPQPVPSIPTPTEDEVQVKTIKSGDTGQLVKNAQLLLNSEIHSSLILDGDFGPATEEAVKALQTFWHVTVDGIVGPITWSLLINY